jgi:hypothetical protein
MTLVVHVLFIRPILTAIPYVSQVATLAFINALLHKIVSADMDCKRNKILVDAKIILTSIRDYRLLDVVQRGIQFLQVDQMCRPCHLVGHMACRKYYNHSSPWLGVNDSKNAIER